MKHYGGPDHHIAICEWCNLEEGDCECDCCEYCDDPGAENTVNDHYNGPILACDLCLAKQEAV